MRLKCLVRVLLVSVGLWACATHAAISPGNETTPTGELFFTVWDATNQVSYTRDLGISVLDLIANPNQSITKAADALYTSTFDGVDPSTLVYSIGAFNARNDDFPAAYGLLISSNAGFANVTLPDVTALFTAAKTGG